MIVTVKNKPESIVPLSVQSRAGIKRGDRLKFSVSSGTITITPAAYKPTKTELAAIRKGETPIERAEHVALPKYLNGLDSNRRKASTRRDRKISR